MVRAATTADSASAALDDGRRARRRRELHGQILKTARSLFQKQGFEATTVEQIAAAADIAAATFFNHFPTKEAVLLEISEEIFERFQSLVRQQLERPASTGERLVGFVETAAGLIERGPRLTRRVLIEVLRSVRPVQDGAQLAGLESHMLELIRAGRAQGDVRDDLEDDLLAELVVSVITGVMTRWIHDPAYPLQDRMRRAAEFLGEALANGGGRPSKAT